jgi:WD40 repeat protein
MTSTVSYRWFKGLPQDWTSFPAEVWVHIIYKLSPVDLIMYGLVCKIFQEISQDGLYWERACKIDYPIATSELESPPQDWRVFYRTQKTIFYNMVDDKKALFQAEGYDFFPSKKIPFDDFVDKNSVVSINGDHLIVVSKTTASLRVRIWNWQTQEQLCNFPMPSNITNRKLVKVCGEITWAANEFNLFKFHTQELIQKSGSDELKQTTEAEVKATATFQQKVTRLFVENGRIALGHKDGSVRVWQDLEIDQSPKELPGNGKSVSCLSLHDSLLLVGGEDRVNVAGKRRIRGTLRVIDLSKDGLPVTQQIKTESKIACIAYHQGLIFAAHKMGVVAWEQGSKEQLAGQELGRRVNVKRMTITEDGLLYTGTKNGYFECWELADSAQPIGSKCSQIFGLTEDKKTKQEVEKGVNIKSICQKKGQLVISTAFSALIFDLTQIIQEEKAPGSSKSLSEKIRDRWNRLKNGGHSYERFPDGHNF